MKGLLQHALVGAAVGGMAGWLVGHFYFRKPNDAASAFLLGFLLGTVLASVFFSVCFVPLLKKKAIERVAMEVMRKSSVTPHQDKEGA